MIKQKTHNYTINLAQEDIKERLKDVISLENENESCAKLEGYFGKDGFFYFQLKRFSYGGLPSYSPVIKGWFDESDSIMSNKKVTKLKFTYKINYTLIIFGVLCLLLAISQYYIYYSSIEDLGNRPLYFVGISLVLVVLIYLTNGHLKKEIKRFFEDSLFHEMDPHLIDKTR